jgi:hypothetical protein
MRILQILLVFLTWSNLVFGQLANLSYKNLSENTSEEQIFLIDEPELLKRSELILSELYNYNFGEAREKINQIKREYPWHPLGYFMNALIEWWKIIPDLGNEQHDEVFVIKIDSAIQIGESLFLINSFKAESSFFLSAAFGMKSQLMLERKNYGKSIYSGRNSLRYLNEVKRLANLNSELEFGIGLYNYYAEWIPKTYPILKAVFLFLPNGDMELGKKQLHNVYGNAAFTNVEAAVYLIEILNRGDEREQKEAVKILHELNAKYPGNQYFAKRKTELLEKSARN